MAPPESYDDGDGRDVEGFFDTNEGDLPSVFLSLSGLPQPGARAVILGHRMRLGGALRGPGSDRRALAKSSNPEGSNSMALTGRVFQARPRN
jgi:hypothetical protein